MRREQDAGSAISYAGDSIQGYRVVYEQIPTGWGAYASDLPGLGVVGESRAEVKRLIREAIPIYLEELARDRRERPWLYTPEQLSPELAAVFARIDAA